MMVAMVATKTEGTLRSTATGLTDGLHELHVNPNGPEVSVRDLRTGMLVAFSATRADREASIREFTEDYFGDAARGRE